MISDWVLNFVKSPTSPMSPATETVPRPFIERILVLQGIRMSVTSISDSIFAANPSIVSNCMRMCRISMARPATPSLIPIVSLARLIRSSACSYPELSPALFPYRFAKFVLVETSYLLRGGIGLQDISSGLDLYILDYRFELREYEEHELLELIEEGCPFPDVPFSRIVQSPQVSRIAFRDDNA